MNQDNEDWTGGTDDYAPSVDPLWAAKLVLGVAVFLVMAIVMVAHMGLIIALLNWKH